MPQIPMGVLCAVSTTAGRDVSEPSQEGNSLLIPGHSCRARLIPESHLNAF